MTVTCDDSFIPNPWLSAILFLRISVDLLSLTWTEEAEIENMERWR